MLFRSNDTATTEIYTTRHTLPYTTLFRSQLALWYLRDKKVGDASVRFDVVAILMLPSGNDIRLIRNAFDFIAPG